MRIIKKGTFDKGCPVGWHIDPGDEVVESNGLEILNKKVYLGGVEMVEWTEEYLESL